MTPAVLLLQLAGSKRPTEYVSEARIPQGPRASCGAAGPAGYSAWSAPRRFRSVRAGGRPRVAVCTGQPEGRQRAPRATHTSLPYDIYAPLYPAISYDRIRSRVVCGLPCARARGPPPQTSQKVRAYYRGACAATAQNRVSSRGGTLGARMCLPLLQHWPRASSTGDWELESSIGRP